MAVIIPSPARNQSLVLPVQDRSQAGEARRGAAAWGRDRGWSQDIAGRVALIVTELGNNLAIHAAGGLILLRCLHGESSGVEILSLDSSPGAANFHECLRDGFSTAGTCGNGLGAVRRASDQFTFHSQPGVGTALHCEVWDTPPGTRPGGRWQFGAVNAAMPGQDICGDSWAVLRGNTGSIRVMIADGSGHGEFAAEASRKAVEIFHENPTMELPLLLEEMHHALRATRGAAVAVAEIDRARGLLSYAGIGNISGVILSHDTSANLVSMNGTIGLNARGYRVFTNPWPADAVLFMASDGLKSQLQWNRYSGLIERPPGLIAGVLYRDHLRGRDDATALAVSHRS
ncbi:MAG TPA: SpoIIE family protein phosphatase [Chthoniobacteraceae bacterium]|nr:SpoIIE family protein phosphatase [Chthoniobacteraceae bacterium]